MKIRKGFVSNSSSSSFIIGVAEVADIDAFKKYAEENGISLEKNYDCTLTTFGELKNKERNGWENEKLSNDRITVDSFDGAEVSISSKDMTDETPIVIYCFFGNEGDHCFYYDDEGDDYDLNYDKVYEADFFCSSEEKMLDMFGSVEASGLKKGNCESTIGASRNG